MKKLLIISYYWPPCGGPGSLRPVKFAKYLPKFDIEPTILTRKNIAYHSLDFELSKEITGIRVVRTESLDPARLLYLLGMRNYKPRQWQRPIKQGLNFPDHKLPWLPFAYNAGMNIDFDYILVTAPPFSSFITGYFLAERTGKPFILDFRDAWLEFPFLPYRLKTQKKFVSYWEKKLTNTASLIITADENIKDSLIKRYPEAAKKTFVIPNGYDPDDFGDCGKPEIFTLSYLGTIREERNPDSILKAIDNLITDKKIAEREIKLKFIGHVEKTFLTKIKKYNFTETSGHLPYQKAIKEFCSSHCAIMITTGSEYFFPSRQNEYLASGLPIIACGKSKGIHLLQTAFEKGYPGWIYDYNDISEIKQKIYDIYKSFKNKKIIKAEMPSKEYTRENLTRKFAELIKKIPKRYG